MADSTNSSEATAGQQLSGDAARQAAIKRIELTGSVLTKKKKKVV